jgi:serine protease Do
MTKVRVMVCLLCVVLAAAGVGGCSRIAQPQPEPTAVVQVVTATPEPTVPPTAVPEPTATPEPEPVKSPAVSRLEDVKSAVVQIEAQGSFVDPEFGRQLNVAGRGSGFLIDSSGLAITNNHVATGAAFLRVWVGGETRARNARVLGVSECSDLAVIQIDGNDFPFLEWFDGDATPGLEVYVAGFPLGDPEFTLTRGIVSKARADGNTDWASVDNVIEHDALLNRGNSGGPLVTRDGKVVGVNFAADLATRQSYAIGRAEVERILGRLVDGQDVNSIGVNGQIVGDGEITGLWVASVESGSPADRSGIKGGDLILELEGLVLGLDGTMSDYCSVLRSHIASDVLSVRVLRFATAEVLEGQINGRELAVSYVLETGPSTSTTIGQYVTIRDDTDTLEMDVPVSWNDVRSSMWVNSADGTVMGPRLVAAPNADAFTDSYGAPGVLFIASRALLAEHDPESFLDVFYDDIVAERACATFDGREEYYDPFYAGVADLYKGCGTSGNADIVIVAAVPDDSAYMVVVWIQYQGQTGLDAATRILNTFWVPGDLP